MLDKTEKAVSRVLLINSPRISDEMLNSHTGAPQLIEVYPPVGLLYLSATVKRDLPGVDVKVVDLHYESIKRHHQGEMVDWASICQSWIDDYRPDMVGLSCMFGASYDYVEQYGGFIREKYPEVILVGGGVHITALAKENTLGNLFDFVCLNEAEYHFCGLLRYLNGEQEDMTGVVAVNDSMLKNPQDLLPGNLSEDQVDNLPMPEWSQIDLESYHKYGCVSASQTYSADAPIATILTERGCTARCTFCSVRNFNGFGVRGHSPERVLGEIDALYKDHGIRHIDLLDDDFTFDRDRVMRIMDGLIARNYDLTLSCGNGVRLGTLDDEMLGTMVEAGVRYFSLGIESGDPKVLKDVKKPLTLEILWDKLPLLHKHSEIYWRANFIIGFPGETQEQMDMTFKLAKDIELDWSLFSICKTLPNTEMYEDLLSTGNVTASKNDDYAFNAVNGTANIELEGQKIFDLAYHKNLALNFRDNTNLKGRNIRRAITDFERVTTIAQDHAVAWNCIAQGYTQLGETDRAHEASTRASKILSESEVWRNHFEAIGMEPVAKGYPVGS